TRRSSDLLCCPWRRLKDIRRKDYRFRIAGRRGNKRTLPQTRVFRGQISACQATILDLVCRGAHSRGGPARGRVPGNLRDCPSLCQCRINCTNGIAWLQIPLSSILISLWNGLDELLELSIAVLLGSLRRLHTSAGKGLRI